ncbi:TIGR03086 family metal-binding protein [Nocardia abscessus]|uniref:TIGR03086 family metal-binding protein n=1 Tax=Nocardia abscessus TaxID=120957 RepID=UPI0007C4ECAE|nr:TIGR03086 family metal-binding protein [Nocardia abscessus]MCC3331657.1 TIGR03086 family protein [Nocardia abscessus]
MTRTRIAGIDAAGLLERAINYTLGSIAAVRPAHLARATPCPGWDLRTLLDHLNDSLDALCEAASNGRLSVGGDAAETGSRPDGAGADPVAGFRDRAAHLRGMWSQIDHDSRVVAIGDRAMRADVLAYVGAVEIAVHGWDIAQSCGTRRPIPPGLADDILTFVELIVPETERLPQFAAPVAAPWSATAGERLLAYLGRDPH